MTAVAPATRVASPPLELDTRIAVARLPGAAALRKNGKRLGLYTIRDLLFHLPRRYDDLRQVFTVRDLEDAEAVADGALVTARLEVVVGPHRGDVPATRPADDRHPS